jgi:hypothetical protein
MTTKDPIKKRQYNKTYIEKHKKELEEKRKEKQMTGEYREKNKLYCKKYQLKKKLIQELHKLFVSKFAPC